METAQINIRVDKATKLGAEKVLEEIGMSMSTALNIYLKKISREGRIPFEVSSRESDPYYSPEHIAYLEQIMQDIDDGKETLEEHELIQV